MVSNVGNGYSRLVRKFCALKSIRLKVLAVGAIWLFDSSIDAAIAFALYVRFYCGRSLAVR